MLVLPTIPEKSALKTSVRRHSIDGQFTQFPSSSTTSGNNLLDRQYTVISNTQRHHLQTPLTNVNFKPALRSKFRDFSFKNQQQLEDEINSNSNSSTTTSGTRLRVNFSLDETNRGAAGGTFRLPPINQSGSLKQNLTLTTTHAVRKSKSSDEINTKKQQRQQQEENIKKSYIDKTEKFKRSQSFTTDHSRRKRKREKKKKNLKELKEGAEDEEDAYEYVEPGEQSEEVKHFVSLVKRLQIHDGQTPQPNSIRALPKQPRLLTSLSVEGQYALMKTYEDTIAQEILTMHPNLAVYVPRVLTSKFRKRLHQPKSLRFLNSNSIDSNNNGCSPGGGGGNREAPPSAMIKQNSFIQQPFPVPNDPNYFEHQLTISQQLEIAQEILDLIKKNKGEYVTMPNLDQNLDILRTYAAYVKIWTKYFHLR